MTIERWAAATAHKRPPGQAIRSSLRRVRRQSGSKNIIVLGSPRRCRAVERALSRFEADVRTLDWSQSISDTANETTVGVIVSEEPPTAPLWKSVGTLRQLLRHEVPVAVLVPEDTAATSTHRLYAAGASVVFEWPRESLLVGPVLAEILGFELVRGPAKRADAALERTIEAHLRLVSPRLGKIRVEVADGLVSLSGAVEDSWMRADAEKATTFVPGVTGVITRGVMVEDQDPDQ